MSALLSTSALLRVTPLISSSFCIWFAWDQYFYLHLFTIPNVRPKSPQVLPSYMKAFYPSASARVAVTWITTMATSIATIYSQNSVITPQQSLWWYKAGLSMTVGHALFAPIILPTIVSILKYGDKSAGQEDIMKLLSRWLNIHIIRSLTVDLFAWVCFVVAVTYQLDI
jgi:hypothetical protein